MAVGYNPRIVTDGLVLALDAGNTKSYPGSGEYWYDLSGKGHTATRTNVSGYGGQVTYNSSGYWDYTVNQPGVTSGAFQGNGFTFDDIILPTTGSFTISTFILRDPNVRSVGDRETIFSNAGGADGWRFQITDTGRLYYLIGGINNVGYQEGAFNAGTSLVDGNWHMATIVYDRAAVFGSSSVYGYIDGTLLNSISIPSNNAAFTATNLPGVGYRGCCDVFAGYIAQLSAYNKALTASEIQQNFNALRGRFGI
mgnify:CR=1 FL=1